MAGSSPPAGRIARSADGLHGGQILDEANTAAAGGECLYDLAERCWTGFVGAFNG